MHKRTSVSRRRASGRALAPQQASRAGWLLPLAGLFAAASFGCPGQELAPLGPCTVSAVTERVDQAGVSDVDLLFVIDNSGSMASEQAKIAKELPRLVEVLTTGDRCAGNEENCTLTDDKEPKRHFTAVKQLHLGVVSSNAGGIDNPTGTQLGVTSCAGVGDDGKLQTSIEVALNGVFATSNREFDGYANGEAVIEPDSACDIGEQPKYQEYAAGGKQTPKEVADRFACVARLGVRGCSFEQQLESMWKALAPSSGDGPKELYEFINGSNGQGEGFNKNFLRPDAILAVIQVSDEEDCSIKDGGKGLFLQSADATTEYGALNLRCGLATERPDYEDLIQPTSRYIEGLKSLKPDNPDRILFAAIVGVPEDAENKSPEDILELPAMRFEENPLRPGFAKTSCTGMTGTRIDEAYPPRRFMEVAAGFGENAVVYSICKDDYAPALDTLIGKIASKLKGNCLPRRLNPDANGRVNCQVFELLNSADTSAKKCFPARGHKGEPTKRPVRENGKVTEKTACEMDQVKVIVSADGKAPDSNGKGWYYDDFSADLKEDCQVGEQQRIQFRFGDGTADLPSGAGATFECFQPVARIDNSAKGFDAINTSCLMGAQDACDERSDNEPGGYKLICIDSSKTCQISCKVNPDCPPGWVCDHAGGDGNDEGELYCQLPTCPADSSSSSSTAE